MDHLSLRKFYHFYEKSLELSELIDSYRCAFFSNITVDSDQLQWEK